VFIDCEKCISKKQSEHYGNNWLKARKELEGELQVGSKNKNILCAI